MQARFVKRSPIIRLALTLALLLAAVLPAMPVPIYAAANAAPNADLALTITPGSNPIQAGETAYFTIELENVSGGPLPNLEMRLPVAGPVDGVRARVESKNGVPQSRMAVHDGGVIWRGGIANNGIIAILIAAKSDPTSGGGTIAIDKGEAGPQDGTPVVTASATVTVNALDEVDLGQLSLTKSIITRDDETEVTQETRYEIGPRNELGLQLQFTNKGDQTVYSLLVDEVTISSEEVEAAGVSEEDRCRIRFEKPRVIEGRGISIPSAALADAGFAKTGYGFLVATPPDSTTTVRVRAQTVGTPSCRFKSEAAAYVTNLPPTENGQFDAKTALALLPQFKQFPNLKAWILFLIIISNDLGDAPDSSNHDGVPMDAYATVPNAAFPTVFDPATGADQGPIHRNPWPLHLGPGVDWELEADRFAGRNIIPTTNTNNLDNYDDGLDVTTLNFTHCMPPQLIDYEFTANQTAVNLLAPNGGVAYVNMWLDGNHDGDWQDTLNCDGITAYEHIVVDQQVSVVAPGVFNLVLSTGNIPIPQNGQNKAMWLRLSISDQPSVKVPAGSSVGDGRGPAGGFLLGETEDYLYRRSQAAAQPPAGQGPDAWLDLESAIVVDDLGLDDDVASADATIKNRRYLSSILKIRNSGNYDTDDLKLVLEIDPYLGIPSTSSIDASWCLTCIVASAVTTPLSLDAFERHAEAVAATTRVPFEEICEDGQCRLEAALGDMGPGASGRIFARFDMPTDITNLEIDVTASLVTNGDVNLGNNKRSFVGRLPFVTPRITQPGESTLGWTGCLTCTVAASSSPLLGFEVAGFAEPGSLLRISADGIFSDEIEVTADEDGFWKGTLSLPDGNHQIVAEYLKIPDVPGESVSALDKSSTKLVQIDSSLPWDPESFGFEKLDWSGAVQASVLLEDDDACGPWSFQGLDGRTDPNNWRIPVFPGSEHEIGVNLTCDGEASAQLKWNDIALELTDEDDDGRYSAMFASPEIDDEVVITLNVICDGVETAYNGLLLPAVQAQVVNAVTDLPLENANVTLWQRNQNGTGAKIAPWNAQTYGQTNPQSTTAQGGFSFIVPPGSYGLTAQIDGFQTFRGGPFSLQGVFPSRSIALTPEAPDGAAAVVSITEDGFKPPALIVPTGATVEWTNTGLLSGSTVAGGGTVNAAAANSAVWDSGEIASGDTYRLQFSEPGTYTYVNAQDPNQEATIIVADPVETSSRVFLPMVNK